MNLWVLIIISSIQYRTAGVQTQEFYSKDSCMFAANQIVEQSNKMNYAPVKRVICVPK